MCGVVEWWGGGECVRGLPGSVTNDRLVADISNFSRARAGPGVT